MSRYAIICTPERFSLVKSLFNRVSLLAQQRGFRGTFGEMAAVCTANGLPVTRATLYGLGGRLPDSYTGLMGIEIALALCKGYNIPLEAVFSVEVVKGMQEQVIDGKGSEQP